MGILKDLIFGTKTTKQNHKKKINKDDVIKKKMSSRKKLSIKKNNGKNITKFNLLDDAA